MKWDDKSVKEFAKELNKLGKGFCLAKWHHVTMHLHTGDNHSCYHPPMHRVELDELAENPSALHNSKYKKNQRVIMLKDERPRECSYCWDIEDLPGDHISDRHLRSFEYEMVNPSMHKIKDYTGEENVNPRYLEISFGNECQMKCMYCTPSVSSAWDAEVKKFGPYPMYNQQNFYQYYRNNKSRDVFLYQEEGNPYIDAFWKWFPEAYKEVETVRITGGEPLLSTNIYKMMDFIDANPNPKLEFCVNSNMSIPERNLNKFIDAAKKLRSENKIGKLGLFTSVDTWGPQAEYIRNGLNLELWEKNVDRYLNEVPPNKYATSVSLMITVNFLSIFNFDKLLDKILEMRRKYNSPNINRISFDTPYLVEPPFLSLRIATDEHIKLFREKLEYMKSNVEDGNNLKFSSLEYSKFERVVNWADQNRFHGIELDINRKDFPRFLEEHDKRRGTDFFKAFPELTDFYNQCKNINLPD